MQIRNQGIPDPLRNANKLFLSDKLTLRPCMEEKFDVELELIDYMNKGAQNYINNWVKNKTGGQISNFVKDLSPDSTATMVSIETIIIITIAAESNSASTCNPSTYCKTIYKF